MHKSIGQNDHKARNFYIGAMIFLMLPLTMLWTTYSFLTMNMSQLAVRYVLSSLIMTLYMFFAIAVYTVKILNTKIEKKT